MSRIYFHNIDHEAEVSGRERHWLGSLCSDALVASLEPIGPWILPFIKPCYLHSGNCGNLEKAIRTWLHVNFDEPRPILFQGAEVGLFDLQLNTAIASAQPGMKLAARIHGQCEIHCWLEGCNRSWLASVIRDALSAKTFRTGEGWEKTIAMLAAATDTPVVLSYSVCDQFPGYHVLPDCPGVSNAQEEFAERWYAKPLEEKWSEGMSALRSSQLGLELSPDDWDSFFFGDRMITGHDIRKSAGLEQLPTAD